LRSCRIGRRRGQSEDLIAFKEFEDEDDDGNDCQEKKSRLSIPLIAARRVTPFLRLQLSSIRWLRFFSNLHAFTAAGY
jgi:hypothetical protein